jgi:hypothetical protein
MLSDVTPCKYHLRVEQGVKSLVAFNPADVVFERELTVTADVPAIKVPLGGGSIMGRISDQSAIIVAPGAGRGPLRHTRCDREGYFCVPFLDPGTYTLFAHDTNGSWCRVDDVKVASDVKNIGEPRPARCGMIRGSISFRGPCPVPDEVIATGPSQVSLEPIKDLPGFDQFELSGLWPGRWTITVRGGGETLATATIEIKGTEIVTLELAAESEKRQ